MNRHKYNILPEMSADEYQILKNDIEKNGYDKNYPIWLYDGEILDGINRQKACDELNIIPIYCEFIGTELEALEFVMRSNKRRNLTSMQWACIAAESTEIYEKLKEEAKERQLKGVANLGESVPKGGKRKDNRATEKIAKLFNTNRKYIEAAKKFKEEKPEVFQRLKSGEELKVIKTEEKIELRKALAEEAKSLTINIDLRHGDFKEVLADIPDGSVDCIITDPPYPYEYIQCWSDLAVFAKRVLKPNGFCIAYSGQFYLPEVMQRMGEHLDYYWTFCLHHTGQGSQIVNGVNLMCRWKPILIYQNGKKKISNTIQDYIASGGAEKDGHDWQQSQDGVSDLIRYFTNPNDLVVDVFAGSATTLIAAHKLNRRCIGAEIDEESYNVAKSIISKNEQTEK